MNVQKIYVGSWFQRTTLHLSEIYDFLRHASSPLKLDKNRLKILHKKLALESVEDVIDDLEYAKAKSKNGIEFKVYEDGLIVLSKEPTGDTRADIDAITSYYEKELSPAISYLFSLGAPIPKEMANIKTIYPYFLITEQAHAQEIEKVLKDFKQETHYKIIREEFEIYRGNELYIINSKTEPLKNIERFIGEQIFIREFKGQLHHYLNLHRIIWENIAAIKERKDIKGREIGGLKTKIEACDKSINLIGTRINQMGTYISTRNAIMKSLPEMEKFASVLRYRHETLNDSLAYVKEIWGMTKGYVSSAIGLFGDLQNQATSRSLQNLTIVTSVGVGATFIGLFTRGTLPKFSWIGLLYFAILVIVGYLVNKIISAIYIRKTYTISEIKEDRDIK